MCTYSMIADHFDDKWKKYQPIPNTDSTFAFTPLATRVDIEELRKELVEMKALLRKALDYDRRNGEPDCQKEDKVERLRAIAKAAGIDATDVLGPEPAK